MAIFTGIAFKLEKDGPTLSSFNPCPSLISMGIEDREQFECLHIVLNITKLDFYFWNSIDAEIYFSFIVLKR